MHNHRTRRTSALAAGAAALVVAGLGLATAGQAQAETGCEVDYRVVSDWGSGFQANVALTAADAVDGWELTWDFPSGTTVTSAWNTDWTQSGTAFTAADVGWNASLASGETREVFGFIGSGSAQAPTAVTLNGVLCDGQIDPTDPPTTAEPTEPPGETVSIMPLGDSITGSPGCWRGNLWDLLVEAGHDISFVGSLSQGCPPSAADPSHEGHGGVLVTQAVANGSARDWLEQNTPDVLLMHFGTNDAWSAIPPAQILAAYTSIVEDLRELNPDALILVAQIIPLHPDPSFGCTDCPQRAIDLNAQIPAWAAGLTTADSPIVVVDQHTGFDPAVDAYDGVHPNEAGYVKIAANWFAALDPMLP
ncbi:cellulose binding domain-containing protein [Glycomyces sp. NPDC046736]|uniref:cellulose binding domain-containing protein n=1 Tax=Glycomyces sp. NPDC046736 TaxID=3155615 RepID=UPI0034075A87